MIYSGFSVLDGDNLFISNLSNGIDLYSLRTMQRLRHYESVVTVNIPFQIALARQALDRVVLGDAKGILQVYDRATGELVQHLEHNTKGRVQVVDVSLPIIVLYTFDRDIPRLGVRLRQSVLLLRHLFWVRVQLSSSGI
jgi:hypothetical protein